MRGKLGFRYRHAITIRDHPRRCGENRFPVSVFWGCLGSPPQVRGKPLPDGAGYLMSRITPAGAGKTKFVNACNFVTKDHPRRCGENGVMPLILCVTVGSPPQVRGKQSTQDSKIMRRRITPAGAGKTRRTQSILRKIQDHPRRCGENTVQHKAAAAFAGSPPQVRGKHPAGTNVVCVCRITPAGAGKTHCQKR